ncbi:MAG: LamG domain-containing protein [Candidatus Wallbacteria bacterium]|nr:LamG domain-containing protein [Candidatus Wallbacteria bacterium]
MNGARKAVGSAAAAAFSLLEVLVSALLAALVLGALTEGTVSGLVGWDQVRRDRERDAACRWAFERMLHDVRESVAVTALASGLLGLETQFVEDADPGVESIEWSLTTDGRLLRAVAPAAPCTYAAGVGSFTPRGPRLWCRLESESDVAAPELGPAGSAGGHVRFSPGIFGDAATVRHQGDWLAFPAQLLDPERGTLELWVDLSTLAGFDDERCLIDTSPGSTGQQLRWTCVGESGRMRVSWHGAAILDWTPPRPAPRFTHLAIAWNRTGLASGSAATLALFADGKRVAGSGAELAPAAFEGSLYIGSSNTPHSKRNGMQLDLPMDNLKIHDVCRTAFPDRVSESDLGPIEVTLASTGGAPVQVLIGGAGLEARRRWP